MLGHFAADTRRCTTPAFKATKTTRRNRLTDAAQADSATSPLAGDPKRRRSRAMSPQYVSVTTLPGPMPAGTEKVTLWPVCAVKVYCFPG